MEFVHRRQILDFGKLKLKPLLEQNCWKCHGADKVRAELVLTTREGVLKGGEVGPAVNLEDPAAGLLLQMVSYKDDDHQMPPIGKLPQEKIDTLAKWIEIGLPFPKEDEIEPKKNDHSHASTTEVNEVTKSHWAFKPPVDHDVPNGKYEHPIDRFIRQKLDKENLPLNPLATDYEILRRASYDLVGLPPSVELVEEYLNDNSPNKFDKLVESLLASPHYGEKWGRH